MIRREIVFLTIVFLKRAQPDYNGVESAIGQVKHRVKRERLSRVLKGQEVDIAELIEIGFQKLKE